MVLSASPRPRARPSENLASLVVESWLVVELGSIPKAGETHYTQGVKREDLSLRPMLKERFNGSC